jgi:hypothetical protein
MNNTAQHDVCDICAIVRAVPTNAHQIAVDFFSGLHTGVSLPSDHDCEVRNIKLETGTTPEWLERLAETRVSACAPRTQAMFMSAGRWHKRR